GVTGIGEGSTVQGSIVDTLAANRGARLAQMNAHLVCPSRLQPAFDQGKLTQGLGNADVGDRPLTSAGLGRAAAPPITSIANQPRVDFSGPGPTTDHREIAAFDRVGAELAAKFSLRFRSARKNHQTA